MHGPRDGEGGEGGEGGGAASAAAKEALAQAREEAARERDGDSADGTRRRQGWAGAAELDLLDPSLRQAAQLAPPQAGLLAGAALRESATSEPALRGRSLEELLPALVRRIAWSGDRHKGTVRLELGAGAFAGATLLVHAEGSRVRVEVGGVGGSDLDRLRARIDARLRGHGLDVESVT